MSEPRTAEDLLFDMEDPLGIAERLLGAIKQAATGAREEGIAEVACIALDRIAEVEEARDKAWKLLLESRKEVEEFARRA